MAAKGGSISATRRALIFSAQMLPKLEKREISEDPAFFTSIKAAFAQLEKVLPNRAIKAT
jgi:hypothetical protein